MVAAAVLAVTSDAVCDRPPAARTTAVCEVPPPAGIAPKSAPPRLAAPVASSSRFARIGGSPGRGEGAPRRDRLGEAHQRDAERARQQRFDQREVRQRERRQSLRNQADRRDTHARRRPKNHDAAMPPPTATSGAGACGHRRSMPISTSSVAAATASVMQRRLGHVMRDAEQVAEEALLRDVDAEQLRHLVQHDHEPDPRLEARQHGRRR